MHVIDIRSLSARPHSLKMFAHVNVGNQSLRVCRVPGEVAFPCLVLAAVDGDGQGCAAVSLGVDLAGLFGDGERPRLARSTVGVLLLSLSFDGVLLIGFAQALGLGPSLFMGSAEPLTDVSGDERAKAVDDTFIGLRLSLSFSFDGVCLLGLDPDDDCIVRRRSPEAFTEDDLPGVGELVELEREGAGVGATHFSGLVLRATYV